LSITGGIIGIILGIGLSVGASYLTTWPLRLSFYPIIISFLFAVGIGLVFGVYPAVKAARLNPIEALRAE